MKFLVRFDPAAIYLPWHPKGNRLIRELEVHAESVAAAIAHGRQVTTGAATVTAVPVPEEAAEEVAC